VPASDLIVLALVVWCIAVVALAAFQSRDKTRFQVPKTTLVDLEGSRIASDEATTGVLVEGGNG
jgi:hypothetical protein